uniref:Uncharacterized protein n=3 Tax=Canis lupus TaxID=9612 RepID=A0A8C0QGR5_CANLF
MSYCWRLQYYCKLGAAHGAGPIYYVSQLPQQAHQFRNQRRVLALPGLSLCQVVSSRQADGWRRQAGEGCEM